MLKKPDTDLRHCNVIVWASFFLLWIVFIGHQETLF